MSRHAGSDHAARGPASAAPAASPVIFTLAAVVNTCARTCSGASRWRIANNAVSCGPSASPASAAPAASAATPCPAAERTQPAASKSVLSQTVRSGAHGSGHFAKTALASSDATARTVSRSAPSAGPRRWAAPSSG
ncbi:hypothetical protein [Amycolatopsis solani]|uniref:hypothetical protein n=1 Tax=Amycolatopsis solani TaxID=3028615 RepID=UPI0025B16B79|nr:hypothetical protein [Amycolatopsis sp. MEP2-6]